MQGHPIESRGHVDRVLLAGAIKSASKSPTMKKKEVGLFGDSASGV